MAYEVNGKVVVKHKDCGLEGGVPISREDAKKLRRMNTRCFEIRNGRLIKRTEPFLTTTKALLKKHDWFIAGFLVGLIFSLLLR
jgi:hypothetical protein